MTIKNVFASVPVKNLNRAEPWYSRLLDKRAQKPMPEVAEWEFDGGGWLQVYELPDRAGGGSFTLSVSSIDEQGDALRRLGIQDAQASSGEKVKTLMITDPDGNHIAFAEPLDPTLAR